MKFEVKLDTGIPGKTAPGFPKYFGKVKLFKKRRLFKKIKVKK